MGAEGAGRHLSACHPGWTHKFIPLNTCKNTCTTHSYLNREMAPSDRVRSMSAIAASPPSSPSCVWRWLEVVGGGLAAHLEYRGG